jgi:uncharacterized protein
MRLDEQRPSDNVDDQRGGSSGGFGGGDGSSGFGGSGGGLGGLGGAAGLLPILFRALGFRGIVILAVLYFALKIFAGVDVINMINGGGMSLPGGTGQIQMPDTSGSTQIGQAGGNTSAGETMSGSTVVNSDAGKLFVSRILASTEDVWGKVFKDIGQTYEQPKLVLFSGYTQSGCGTAKSAMGPFYCPSDHKVYIDLAFYQDMKDQLGAPGDFAQAYVIAHEVGHHVQTLLGISDQVQSQRSSASEADSNALSVRMELQADCLAGIWASEADATKHILESGDIEEALNAASQIGDDRLQKRSQGYAVPDTFTHGSSAQRVKWFKQGMAARSLKDCDTFSADPL